MDWGKKCLADSNTGKGQPVLFDRSNNTGSIDMKMDGSVLEENYLLRFFLLRFLCIPINLSYVHVRNTVLTSGLEPLSAT